MSIYSGTSSHVPQSVGSKHFKLRIVVSILLIIIALSPAIAALVIFKLVPDQKFSLLHVEEGDGHFDLDMLNMVHVNTQFIDDEVSGVITDNCENIPTGDLIQVINMTHHKCRSFYKKLVRYNKNNLTIKALIILDRDPETHWRLSSPVQLVKIENCPVFRVRDQDWKNMESSFE